MVWLRGFRSRVGGEATWYKSEQPWGCPGEKTKKGIFFFEAKLPSHSFLRPCEVDETKSAWVGSGVSEAAGRPSAPIRQTKGVHGVRETPLEGGPPIGRLKSQHELAPCMHDRLDDIHEAVTEMVPGVGGLSADYAEVYAEEIQVRRAQRSSSFSFPRRACTIHFRHSIHSRACATTQTNTHAHAHTTGAVQ
jgi:hypothetical protein